jgi:hypothetical protein
LLDHIKVPGLSWCDLLVETHDFVVPGTMNDLENRFSMSHDIIRISQGGRNPNEMAEFAGYPESDRWLMVDENRQVAMTWLACWARPLRGRVDASLSAAVAEPQSRL